jgi:site-specific recombinase XerD
MYLFESFIGRVEWIRRYKTGPLLEERDAFLRHLHNEGHSVRRLRVYNKYLLPIAELIDLSENTLVTSEQVMRAAAIWSKQHCRASSKVRTRLHDKHEFCRLAMKWLRFLGMWEDSTSYRSFQVPMDSFLQHLGEEMGHTAQTILTRKSALRPFFSWLAAQNCALSEVRPEIVAAYFMQHKSKGWKRATVAAYAESLRMFFRFAEQQRWCEAGIAAAIERPRMYSLSELPQGPAWETVQQIIASVDGNRPGCIRDRAIILLLAVYGLRIGEVVNLTLDDIDWQHDRIWIKRLTRRLPQEYPLISEVGDAILRYLREVRPHCAFRNVFLRLQMPHRPLCARGLNLSIALRMRAIGPNPLCRGPHSLRHSCASHLLAQGFSIKVIGSHLGHESVRATQIYAKVDERRLREVADMNLDPLKNYVLQSSIAADDQWVAERLIPLREVVNSGVLGGVL